MTATEKQAPNAKQREKLLAQVHEFSKGLRSLLTTDLPTEDFAAMHERVSHLDGLDPNVNGFDPERWAPALEALRLWATAAYQLAAEAAKHQRRGRAAAPRWRREFAQWIAST
ncbi:MAG: hypothetical protein EPO12_06695, partial [Aquabacterium sp.]